MWVSSQLMCLKMIVRHHFQTQATANPKAIATQLKSTIKEKPNPEEFRTWIECDPLFALAATALSGDEKTFTLWVEDFAKTSKMLREIKAIKNILVSVLIKHKSKINWN